MTFIFIHKSVYSEMCLLQNSPDVFSNIQPTVRGQTLSLLVRRVPFTTLCHLITVPLNVCHLRHCVIWQQCATEEFYQIFVNWKMWCILVLRGAIQICYSALVFYYVFKICCVDKKNVKKSVYISAHAFQRISSVVSNEIAVVSHRMIGLMCILSKKVSK